MYAAARIRASRCCTTRISDGPGHNATAHAQSVKTFQSLKRPTAKRSQKIAVQLTVHTHHRGPPSGHGGCQWRLIQLDGRVHVVHGTYSTRSSSIPMKARGVIELNPCCCRTLLSCKAHAESISKLRCSGEGDVTMNVQLAPHYTAESS